MDFQVVSSFKPTGDQPEAIQELSDNILASPNNDMRQTLLGITGSGKTFTVANVVEKVQCPTLVLSHNKTLAAQLYSEFCSFFPHNAVEYFVSYYDYFQPEAYIPVLDKYIEKDLQINDEIEKMRLSTTSSLLSGRRDVLVVSSVSCIYGIGNPEDYETNTILLQQGSRLGRDELLRKLVDALYSRDEINFSYGKFRVKGDTVDVFPAYSDTAIRISFWGDEIEEIKQFSPSTGGIIERVEKFMLYPASIFTTTRERLNKAIREIEQDMYAQRDFFAQQGNETASKRIEDRVIYDIEMMRELGYCSGIENYSRYFDGRKPGMRPFCLLDYFPDDFLLVVDESHVTLPQIRAMYGGDKSRKMTLVEYGFRLPAAMDNRPLKFEEFEAIAGNCIYVSATPAEWELERSGGVVVEQIIRPTGLVDPPIEVRPTKNQIDDLLEEIRLRAEKDERVLVTTLTKKMAEELTDFLKKAKVSCNYIHSDVDTLDRVTIMDDLRKGIYDVLIGVNLLREGLDLPEVSLVVILDADKEGFLRNEKSLIQTSGRAARNINGKVIMYADKLTQAIKKTIEASEYRREKQIAYNQKHHITPKQIVKGRQNALTTSLEKGDTVLYETYKEFGMVADPIVQYLTPEKRKALIKETERKMKQAAVNLDFEEATRMRDELFVLRKKEKK